MEERWRDIPGYEDSYQVSDLGNVKKRAHKVFVNCSTAKKGIVERIARERKLALDLLKKGLRVTLRDEFGARRFFYVDRLVLYCFVGTKSGCYPHHIDGNILNNKLHNLEWRESEDAQTPDSKILKPKVASKYKKILTQDEVETAFTDMRDNKIVGRIIGVSPLCVELIKKRIIWTQYTDGLKREKRQTIENDQESLSKSPKLFELVK